MSQGHSTQAVTGKSTVNLVRSSHPWTEADNAAGFVLRYLVPMRRQLTQVMSTEPLADNALKLLLAHLVSAGFGDHKKGRLRDFLLRGVRSAAKTAVNELPEEKRSTLSLESVTLDSKQWLTFWREGLLERAWRSLERFEHSSPGKPLYTVLQASTAGGNKTPTMLAAQIASEGGIQLGEASVMELLAEARTLFAQLIADEVAETLEDPKGEDVKQEIATLGLSRAFDGIAI